MTKIFNGTLKVTFLDFLDEPLSANYSEGGLGREESTCKCLCQRIPVFTFWVHSCVRRIASGNRDSIQDARMWVQARFLATGNHSCSSTLLLSNYDNLSSLHKQAFQRNSRNSTCWRLSVDVRTTATWFHLRRWHYGHARTYKSPLSVLCWFNIFLSDSETSETLGATKHAKNRF